MELNITITKTAVGNKEYIQIMSDDTATVNIVLVVDKINVKDAREDTNSMTDECWKTGRLIFKCPYCKEEVLIHGIPVQDATTMYFPVDTVSCCQKKVKVTILITKEK